MIACWLTWDVVVAIERARDDCHSGFVRRDTLTMVRKVTGRATAVFRTLLASGKDGC